MSGFDSLSLACEGWFDKPLCDLPIALRQRVEENFFPVPWDWFTAAGRRNETQRIDDLTDPKMEQLRKFSWDKSERMISITMQIAKWEAVATPTALDLAQKETRLTELRQEFTHIEAEEFAEDGPIESPRNPAQPTNGKTGNAHLTHLSDSTAAGKPPGSTVRRDARKLTTQAMYKQWNKAYRAAIKERLNMSDIWYSQHIAKMPIAKNRNAETIRKHMKS